MVGGAEPYHQVGGAGDHDAGFRLPDADTTTPIAAYDQRPLYRMAPGAGRNLLARSAAALAVGSTVYASDAAYAARLLAAAQSAYTAAQARAQVQNPDPPDFYMEDSGDDDLALAAAELALATGQASYAADAQTYALALAPAAGQPIGWFSVDALALAESARALAPTSAARAQLTQKLDALAAPLAATDAAPMGPGAAFHYALPALGDGSLAESLGAAASCLAARRLDKTANGACAEVARSQLHWLLGQNPFGVSFLVGAGDTNPQNLHHALAQSAPLTLTGAIVGGPTSAATLTAAALPLPPASDLQAPFSTDALLYEDAVGDYVTNEPAIDFTAALVYTVGELLDPP
jgi:endoglucanase